MRNGAARDDGTVHQGLLVLICGVGRTAQALLTRLGGRYRVILLDRDAERLREVAGRFREEGNVVRTHVGDASSPVVLEEAGLAEADAVLALTDADKVNLAICRFAREASEAPHSPGGGKHILGLCRAPALREDFLELGVRVVDATTPAAMACFHYLQNPAVRVQDLAGGKARLFELTVAAHHRLAGRSVAQLGDEKMRVVGLVRGGALAHPAPDAVVEAGDTVLILGEPGLFKPLCSLLTCGRPEFPLAYGRDVLAVLHTQRSGGKVGGQRVLDEARYLPRATRAGAVQLLCHADSCSLEENIENVMEETGGAVLRDHAELPKAVARACAEGNIGVVVMAPVEASFFASLTRATLVGLAHSLPVPLLIARGSAPYERILVPFNGSRLSALALETALDLARQTGACVRVVVVREPGFITGDDGHDEQDEADLGEETAQATRQAAGNGGNGNAEIRGAGAADGSQDLPVLGDWAERTLAEAREQARTQNVAIRESLAEGNPVREIMKTLEEHGHDLLVIGSSTPRKGLLAPHLGEELAKNAPCSVLVLTG